MLLHSLSYHALQEMLFFWEIVRLDSSIFCRAELLNSASEVFFTVPFFICSCHCYSRFSFRRGQYSCSQIPQILPCSSQVFCRVPSAGVPSAHLVLQLWSNRVLLSYENQDLPLCLLPHDQPSSPCSNLSHEAAPVLSCRCCLEAAVPMSSSMFPIRETSPNSWCPSRTQHYFFCMLRKMVINLVCILPHQQSCFVPNTW